MPTFDRPRAETLGRSPTTGEVPPDAEQEGIVFEEVDEEIVFEEDPVEQRTRAVLDAEKQVADAQRKADSGRDGKQTLLVAEVLLANAKVEREKINQSLGRSKPGEVARLRDELQTTQNRLDAFNSRSITSAREAAFARFAADDTRVGSDTEELWKRLAS
jgi:hypothetical protein